MSAAYPLLNTRARLLHAYHVDHVYDHVYEHSVTFSCFQHDNVPFLLKWPPVTRSKSVGHLWDVVLLEAHHGCAATKSEATV